MRTELTRASDAGNYPVFKLDNKPAVPGTEAVGEIASESKKFKKGQRVCAKHWSGIATASGNCCFAIHPHHEKIFSFRDSESMQGGMTPMNNKFDQSHLRQKFLRACSLSLSAVSLLKS